jgi:alkyl hydroperoxide reductase subunit AhpF
MSLVSPADQQKLREVFAEMTRPVRLVFFTQTLECETCPQTKQILDELPPLSDKIAIEEVNLILDGDRARQYGIDRVPAVAIEYLNHQGAPGAQGAQGAQGAPGHLVHPVPPDGEVWIDSRMRFLGAPAGYEFISLVQAVLLAGGRPSTLSENSRRHIAAVDRPVVMNVFTTPT